ncbi:MAG: response regulator [Candidatus Omnitrophota bacterium]|jgi:CheY-like chemotaxis protein
MGQVNKILVIDDEPRIRALYCQELIGLGYKVLAASDGKEAIDLLRKNSDVQMALLDILLPESSGLDVFDMIKKEFPQIKILISSVYPKDEQQFLVCNADGYYYKLDSLSVLHNEVSRLLTARFSLEGRSLS